MNYSAIDKEDYERAIMALLAGGGSGGGGGGGGGVEKVHIANMAGMTEQNLFRADGTVAVFFYMFVEETIFGEGSIGEELIVNGGFTGNANNWTLETGWTYGANNAVVTLPADNQSMYQTIATMPTGRFKFSCYVDAPGAVGTIALGFIGQPDAANIYLDAHDPPADFTVDFNGDWVPDTDRIVEFKMLSGSTGTIVTVDNVSLKPLYRAQLLVGTDAQHDIFMGDQPENGNDIETHPLESGGIIFYASGQVTIPSGTDASAVYVGYNAIKDMYIKCFPSNITQGAAIFFVQWFPLSDGATLTVD